MDVEKILSQLVRVGTVTDADPDTRTARVKFRDTGMTSGRLFVLASRPYIPDYEVSQRTEFDAECREPPVGVDAFASHRHMLRVKPWMPKINATVLTLYLPILDADGFILGEIGELGKLKQWTDQ